MVPVMQVFGVLRREGVSLLLTCIEFELEMNNISTAVSEMMM